MKIGMMPAPRRVGQCFPGVGIMPKDSEERLEPSFTMVDAFVGTWKLVDSKNFDDYMKSLG